MARRWSVGVLRRDLIFSPHGRAVLLLMLVASSFSAAAQQEREGARVHAGVGLASISFKDRYQGVAYGDASVGWQAYAGYRISDRIAVELARKSFGGIEARDVPGSGVERLDISTRLDVSLLRAVMELPLADLLRWRRGLWAFATVGYHGSTVRREATPVGGGNGESRSARDSGLAFGGGVLVEVGRFELRAHLEGLDTRRLQKARDIGVAVQFRF